MKRALISVYDKKGIIPLCKRIKQIRLGNNIYWGGTYKILKGEGVDVVDVAEVTKFPEILDGRVKTIHPNIHGGLLYKRDDMNHVDKLKELNINSIDMVVNNLYPL